MEVLPTAAGKLFVSVTVTTSPSVTIRVGPGSWAVGQLAPPIASGLNPNGAPEHP